MSGTQVLRRFRGVAVDVPAPMATPRTRQPRQHTLLGAAFGLTLLAVLALSVVAGYGVRSGWYVLTVAGGSMEPTISRGDLVVVAPPPSRVEPGMILVMTVGGEVVTHRVVAVNADGTVVTRGDANSVNDTWASREIQVEGLYVATIPWLGPILPMGNASRASFADGVGATMHITVGPWPTDTPATPPECADTDFSQVLVGTPGDDRLIAGNGKALVFGLGGNDTIEGGNARDCLVGGEGNDTLVGGNGKDVLLGGEGDDALYGSRDGGVSDGGNGRDLLDGGDGMDACEGTKKDEYVSCETVADDGKTAPGERSPGAPEPTPVVIDPPMTPPTGTPLPDGPVPAPARNPVVIEPPPLVIDPPVTPDPSPETTPEPTPDPTSEPTPEPTPDPTPPEDPTPDPTPPEDPTPAP